MGGDIIFSHGVANARGTCILFPKHCKGDALSCNRDQDGRIISILLNIQDITINLVGIYAPTQDHGQQQTVFYMKLGENIRSLELSHPLILCGDINVHLSAQDTSQAIFRPTSASDTVHEIMREGILLD